MQPYLLGNRDLVLFWKTATFWLYTFRHLYKIHIFFKDTNLTDLFWKKCTLLDTFMRYFKTLVIINFKHLCKIQISLKDTNRKDLFWKKWYIYFTAYFYAPLWAISKPLFLLLLDTFIGYIFLLKIHI